jgi:hypothetical protein
MVLDQPLFPQEVCNRNMIACEFCHKRLRYHYTFNVFGDDTWYFGDGPNDLNSMYTICRECVNIIFEYMRKNVKCKNNKED